MERLIVVSAVVVRDAAGRILTVRKRGTSRFMLPGGKPEAGETAAQTAARELMEETGIAVAESDLDALGEFESVAANEPDHLLRSTVFTMRDAVADADSIRPVAEIEEVRWLDLGEPLPTDLAPMLEGNVIPKLRPRH